LFFFWLFGPFFLNFRVCVNFLSFGFVMAQIASRYIVTIAAGQTANFCSLDDICLK